MIGGKISSYNWEMKSSQWSDDIPLIILNTDCWCYESNKVLQTEMLYFLTFFCPADDPVTH